MRYYSTLIALIGIIGSSSYELFFLNENLGSKFPIHHASLYPGINELSNSWQCFIYSILLVGSLILLCTTLINNFRKVNTSEK